MGRKRKERDKEPTIELPLTGPRAKGRLLALDVSSQCVGWAFFEDGGLVSYGKFHPTGPDQCHGQRLESFREWLIKVLEDVEPKYLVVERAYEGPRSNAFPTLQLYQAVVLQVHYAHYRCELRMENRLLPSQVKHTLSFPSFKNYEKRKQYAVEWVNRVYKLDLRYKVNDRRAKVSDSDPADAIALGHAWILRGITWTK